MTKTMSYLFFLKQYAPNIQDKNADFRLKSFPDVNDENFLKIQKSLADSFLKMKMCVTAKTLIPPLAKMIGKLDG